MLRFGYYIIKNKERIVFMKKELLSLLLVLVLAVMVPVSAAAAGGYDYASGESFGDYEYEVLSNGTASVKSYKGSAATVNIPSSINGKKVTEIGYGAFAGSSTLKSVSIPDTVTKIGSSAFAVCDALKIINIPNSVTYIGSDAFYLTPWIENYPNDFVIVGNGVLVKYKGSSQSVAIPATVTAIGYGAFSDTPQIKSVTIPNSVTLIDGLAFFYTDLEQAVIPTSVTKIGEMAFQGCSKLTSITIPSTVKQIDADVFYRCDNVTVKCRKNSVAEQYCKNNNIRYEASNGTDTPPADKDNIPKRKGDIDGDGEITANDALMILRASVGLTELNEKQKAAADIDGDGSITSADALIVLRYSVGAEKTFS